MSIARAVLLRASRSKWLAEQFRKRKFAKRAVKRFMPGEDVGSALDAAAAFAREGIGTLLTELGEQIENVGQAAEVRDDYFKLLDQIAARIILPGEGASVTPGITARIFQDGY
jgi:proline dehydrogenase